MTVGFVLLVWGLSRIISKVFDDLMKSVEIGTNIGTNFRPFVYYLDFSLFVAVLCGGERVQIGTGKRTETPVLSRTF